MTAHGVRQMLKRRLHEAGLPEIITPHSFRVMVVTDLLGQAGHSNPQTTQIYDRRRRRVTPWLGHLHSSLEPQQATDPSIFTPHVMVSPGANGGKFSLGRGGLPPLGSARFLCK